MTSVPNSGAVLPPTEAFLENQTVWATAAWFDQNGNPFIPAAASYRLDYIVGYEQGVLDSVQVLAWTALTPATTNTVVITSAQNALVSATGSSELHQVLFQCTDAAGNINYARGLYNLVRVAGG